MSYRGSRYWLAWRAGQAINPRSKVGRFFGGSIVFVCGFVTLGWIGLILFVAGMLILEHFGIIT